MTSIYHRVQQRRKEERGEEKEGRREGGKEGGRKEGRKGQTISDPTLLPAPKVVYVSLTALIF